MLYCTATGGYISLIGGVNPQVGLRPREVVILPFLENARGKSYISKIRYLKTI